ncbi:hypothetical protein DFH07DRAFT_758178 [Mycena maculata]|uniref:Alpha-type protein kinase domain-containing protein n=1 Tax=Mycena maculata TaxID=230809 RepID=A0AAD7HRW7_9AGAR|nr:hypothetical protein DFH07DRAFT_758178 [Mycena maculata]
MDIISFDQHDKWKRFGLWLHVGLDPFSGRVAWLRIWWTNRNPKLITSYYIKGCRKIGGELVFRWLAIPWLQLELDNYVERFNATPRRADKHKILPQGIPDLIASKPEQYSTTDYKVIVSPDEFDEMEATWAPPHDPVFKLTPDTFHSQAIALYTALGSPIVTLDSFWIVYADLLNAFETLPLYEDDDFQQDIQRADDHFEAAMELLADQRELRNGDNRVGYEYLGGLSEPPPAMDSDDDPRDFAHQCEFTPMVNKSCDRCLQVPPDGALAFLHPLKAGQSGRYVCPPCYQHYMAKGSTVTSPAPSQYQSRSSNPPAFGFPLINMSNSNLGHGSGGPPAFGSRVLTSWPNPEQMLLFDTRRSSARVQAAQPVTSSSAPYYTSGPRYNSGASSSMPPPSGYTTNHLKYAADRHRRSQQAYAAQGGYVVVIEARASVMLPGKTTQKLVGDVLEVVDDVGCHIGADDLKRLCFDALLPVWNEFTSQFPLSIDDVTLRDDKWAVVVPRNPDVDAIAHKFFHAAKKPNGAPQFRSKKLVMNIHIPNRIWDAYNAARDAALEQVRFAAFHKFMWPNTLIILRTSSITSSGKSRCLTLTMLWTLRSRNASQNGLDRESASNICSNLTNLKSKSALFISSSQGTSQTSTRTPPSKRICLPDSPESPAMTRDLLERVLGNQTPSSKMQLGALCAFFLKTVNAVVHPLKPFTKMGDLNSTTSDWRTFCGPPRPATLMLDMDPKRQMVGAFKMATLGESSPALFDDPTNFDICIKQTFYSKAVKGASITQQPRCNIPHDAQSQAKGLTTEVRCLAWAHVLLSSTYTFIRRFIRDNGPPPFAIPQLRYVKGALASSQGAERDLFLVEERIMGTFRKYINNRATIPTVFPDAVNNETAKFLAFTQHYQYWSSYKMVFISDYQGTLYLLCCSSHIHNMTGGDTLLTDPQIMSSPYAVLLILGLEYCN